MFLRKSNRENNAKVTRWEHWWIWR